MLLLRGGRQMLVSCQGPCPTSKVLLLQSNATRRIMVSAERYSSQSAGEPGQHGSGGHGHDDHHHDDPWANWVQAIAHPVITRHSQLKMPMYIGSPPRAGYRAPYDNSIPLTRIGSYVIATMMWWWMTWNYCMEPGHVWGEHFWPDRYYFSDAELGVPPLPDAINA